MIEHKYLFSDIEFKTNKTLSKFADQFYHKAQVLLRASVMVEHNAKLAMKNTAKPYKVYHGANVGLSLPSGRTHNAPNKEKPRYNRPVNANTPAISSIKICQTQERQIPLTDIICYCCQNKEHYATKCPNGQKIHVVYVPAKEQGKDQAQ
ncbi:hypothetical protein DSO57_1002315 [Entomophthora muscae]|uniref:Uncharacterized protein n=1 Tax=Entomophthora muscae TaxID=34485 RepID=A0ACC2UIE1_9FUNG|nr:hypothetical protein DSO57_1002315 [Entomophthora muscae]